MHIAAANQMSTVDSIETENLRGVRREDRKMQS